MLKLTNPEREIYIIQHLESGDYDFPDCKTCEEAAVEDWQDDFWMDDDIETREEARERHLNTFQRYTPTEILDQAENGYGYLIELGLIEVIEEETKP